MKKLLSILLLSFVLFSCGEKKTEAEQKQIDKEEAYMLKPESSGRINHIILVIDPLDWKGVVGDAFREIISDPIEGLPQPEYKFHVSNIPVSAFGKMFQKSRNLLVIQVSDKEVFRNTSNLYAKPQTILEVKSTSKEALVKLIKAKKNDIINVFRDGDLAAVQKLHKKEQSKTDFKALKSLKASMVMPNKYRVVMDTLGSFLWTRSHIAGGLANGDQTNNILVYEMPLFHTETPILNQVIANRDKIGKQFIRGNDEETMYMITEAARVPTIIETTINGYKAYETRGTWEVFGAFNAGPFLNYSIIDKANNRVLVVEGFNYAPSVNKRDFMFELEAILKSIALL
ncbi:DUF4837 family protein [Flavobacteriaceae bacterium]|nr:DUF4837 family protein [Flavobacteriaceae bacterium]